MLSGAPGFAYELRKSGQRDDPLRSTAARPVREVTQPTTRTCGGGAGYDTAENE